MSAFEWCLELPLASGLCDGRSSAARRKSAAPAEETLPAIPTPMDAHAHYTNTINTLLNYTELLENNIDSLTPSLTRTRTSHSI